MNTLIALDDFDRRLLEVLQIDTQRSMAAIAEAVGLSAPACYRRIRRLRKAGVIEREVAIVRPRTLGWPLSMIVMVTLEREAAVIRITRGNFRLMERLFAQMRRIMTLNRVDQVSPDIVQAARDCLVIGPGN